MTVAGRKVAGSAQTRKEGVILQHGSILLDADVDLLFSLLRVPEGAGERLKARFRAKATTLREALGRPISYDEARDAFAHGFATGLGLVLEAGALTEEELSAADVLEHEKYGSDTWNLKK